MPEDSKALVNEPEVRPNGYEVVHSKSPVFYEKYERKDELQHQTHYCPGCGHGVAHKLIAEAIGGSRPAGSHHLLSVQSAARLCVLLLRRRQRTGRARSRAGAATAIKRTCPDKIVIAYQGDGDPRRYRHGRDHSRRHRGEKITVFFVNNAIYGMTGGQMAPTTLVGQKSTNFALGTSSGGTKATLYTCPNCSRRWKRRYTSSASLSPTTKTS